MDRKQKYTLIKKTTGNSKLAQKARDWSEDRINREILSMYAPSKEVIIKRQMRSDNRRQKRLIIRNAGYSPVEADRMVSWSWKRINDALENNVVVNKKARRDRWKSMSKRRKLDPESISLAQRLNRAKHEELLRRKGSKKDSDGLYKIEYIGKNRIERKVFDKNHNFGWSIAYYVYTEGADPDKWFKAVKIDPFIPEIYRLPNTISI